MSESSACNISDNELQKSTTLKLFANAILCQKCVQMSQRTTQYDKGPWLNAEQLLVHQRLMCRVPTAMVTRQEGKQAGTRRGHSPVLCTRHLGSAISHCTQQQKGSLVTRQWGLGTEERTVLYALSRRRQSQPGSSWNSDPASQTRNPLNPTLTGGAAFVHPMHTCWSGSSSILPHFRNS